MSRDVFWRIIVAVIVIVALNAIIVPLSHLIGFPLNGDALTILRVCIAAIVVLYIINK